MQAEEENGEEKRKGVIYFQLMHDHLWMKTIVYLVVIK